MMKKYKIMLGMLQARKIKSGAVLLAAACTMGILGCGTDVDVEGQSVMDGPLSEVDGSDTCILSTEFRHALPVSEGGE